MKKRSVFTLLVIVFIASYVMLKYDRPIKNSMTLDFIILNKIEENQLNYIYIRTLGKDSKEGRILVNDLDLFKSLEEKIHYFGVVSWESYEPNSLLFSEKTNLEQIEPIIR